MFRNLVSRLATMRLMTVVGLSAMALFIAACGSSDPAAPVVVEKEVIREVEVIKKEFIEVEVEKEVVKEVEKRVDVVVTATPAPTPAIKRGGTLKVGMLSDHVTFDIPLVVGMPDIVTMQATNDVLVFRNPDLSLRPALATKWTPNEDASSWTFELRKGIHFNHYENGAIVQGKEFKAEDVIFTINRMYEMDSPTVSTISPTKPVMTAVDDYTLKLDFDGPNATLLEGLVKYQSHISPSNVDPSLFESATYGTGPFIMTSHTTGELTTFIANPNYWLEDSPRVDELVFVFLPSVEARAEALKAGMIDMIFDLHATSIPGLKAHPETQVLDAPSGGYMNYAMIVTEPPFDNKLVRQALQMATDREAILQGAQFGMGSVAYDHPIARSSPVFNADCMPPAYNPEGAKDLLKQAGYPDGIDLTIHTSTSGASMVEMATILKESFKPAGINLDIVVMPEDGYWAEGWLVKPLTTVWWGGRPPYEGFNVVYRGGGSWNESFWQNDRFDALLDQAKSAGTLEEQKEIYGEMQCIVVDEVPRVVTVFRPVTLGVRNYVREATPMWDATMILHHVWMDK
jgi:peptide/nickel transport system substrate-binding protein